MTIIPGGIEPLVFPWLHDTILKLTMSVLAVVVAAWP
jgi:hypothetical protein